MSLPSDLAIGNMYLKFIRSEFLNYSSAAKVFKKKKKSRAATRLKINNRCTRSLKKVKQLNYPAG